MATMRQVAQRAGVSVMTLSHMLNGTQSVDEEVRARIEEAMKALAYVPSALIRSLKHNVSRTLGMMIPNNSNPYFAEIIRIIEDLCFDADYNLVLCNTDNDPYKQSVYLRVLMEKHVDGLIVMSSGDSDDLPLLLSKLTIPLVLIDRQLENNVCDIVMIDHQFGAYLATQHLVELGHQHIACLSGPPALAPSVQRENGWRQALEKANLPLLDPVVGHFSSEGGYKAMIELLNRPQRPSAVFACNDLMAIGALCAAYEYGLRVPEQLSIVGLDDIELAAYTCPPLTTVAQPKQEIGEKALELLFERLNLEREEMKKITLQPTLQPRKSTAAPL